MAFKEVVQAPQNPAFGFGGVNKKTGKAYPKQYEGYFLGSRGFPDKENPEKLIVLHTLRTKTGDIDLWSKADLTRKMKNVPAGTMVRLTLTDKTQKVGKGTMKVFLVEEDPDLVIEVPAEYAGHGTSGELRQEEGSPYEETTQFYGAEDSDELDGEEVPADELPPARPTTQVRRSAPDPARAAKVQALLNGRGSKAAG